MTLSTSRPQARSPLPPFDGELSFLSDAEDHEGMELVHELNNPRLAITCAALDRETRALWLGTTRGVIRLGPEGDVTHIKLQNEPIQACCWTPAGLWVAGSRNVMRLHHDGPGVQKIPRLTLGMGDARVRSMSGDEERVCLALEGGEATGLPLVWIDVARGMHTTRRILHERMAALLAVHVRNGRTWVLLSDQVLVCGAPGKVDQVLEPPIADALAPWPWNGHLPPRELGCVVAPLAQSNFYEVGNHVQFLLAGWVAQLDVESGELMTLPTPASLLRSLSTHSVPMGRESSLLATYLGVFYSAGSVLGGGVVPLVRGPVVAMVGSDPTWVVTQKSIWRLKREKVPRTPLQRIPGELGMDMLRSLVAQALHSADPDRRIASLKLLGHLPGMTAPEVPDAALLDNHAGVSETAIRLLFHLAGTAAAVRLRSLFPGLSVHAQRNVVRVLIERGLAPPLDCYRDLVRHPAVLQELLGLIDRLPQVHARELVLECLVHPQLPLRSRARTAVKWLHIDHGVQGLVRELASGHPAVRLEAARSLPLTRDELALHLVASHLPGLLVGQTQAALESLVRVLPGMPLSIRLREGLVQAVGECTQLDGRPGHELLGQVKRIVTEVTDTPSG